MTDIVLCAIPRMSIYYPPAGPAILKGCLNSKNLSSVIMDFVIDFHERFFGTDLWEEINNWMIVHHFYDEKIVDILTEVVDEWVDEILKHDPTWVGISVFSYESYKITKLLVYRLKARDPKRKIILGGAGVTDGGELFVGKLVENGLVDKIITGDGEESILELFGFDDDIQFTSAPMADFSDYDLDKYKVQLNTESEVWQGFGNYLYFNSIITLPLTGSRGCVRKCTFCDIPKLWPKFKYRSADSIHQEIIYNHRKFGANRFHFTDSLINGNVKEFMELCRLLAENKSETDDFTFTGQYICRNHKYETDEQYKLMADAGIKILEVGVETGSDAVRHHMGKKFTNEDIDVFVRRCSDNDIKIVLLMIVGYPTETEEDFQDTLSMLERLKPYVENGTIIEACLGGTLRVEPNTALSQHPGIHFQDDDGTHLNWIFDENPELTLDERIDRRYRILKHTEYLGYHSPTNKQELLYLESQS